MSTNNINEAERAAFEAWAADHLGQGYPLTMEEGSYLHPVTRWAFKAFKDGRAALSSTPSNLTEGEPLAWATFGTKDGKMKLSSPTVASNPEYVKVHKEWAWEPLYRAATKAAAPESNMQKVHIAPVEDAREQQPVAYAVVSVKGGIHKLSITKESADRKAARWQDEWPNNGCKVRPLVYGDVEAGSEKAQAGDPRPECWCQTCNAGKPRTRMILCPTCGNKRCPHANNHANACTGSNEPGQPGSAYPAAPSHPSQAGEKRDA